MNIIKEYKSRNTGSLKAYEKAKILLPSGNTRSALFWRPFPLCMRKGEGSNIWDVDGNSQAGYWLACDLGAGPASDRRH